MNSRFKKELTKVLVLLVAGVVLLIAFLIYTDRTYGIKSINDLTGANNVLVILMVLFCPLGIFYGWKTVYFKIRSADRPPRDAIGTTTVMITIMNICLAFTVTVVFGWIYGVYNAIKSLLKAKNEYC